MAPAIGEGAVTTEGSVMVEAGTDAGGEDGSKQNDTGCSPIQDRFRNGDHTSYRSSCSVVTSIICVLLPRAESIKSVVGIPSCVTKCYMCICH